jgi:hypothetical protein
VPIPDLVSLIPLAAADMCHSRGRFQNQNVDCNVTLSNWVQKFAQRGSASGTEGSPYSLVFQSPKSFVSSWSLLVVEGNYC